MRDLSGRERKRAGGTGKQGRSESGLDDDDDEALGEPGGTTGMKEKVGLESDCNNRPAQPCPQGPPQGKWGNLWRPKNTGGTAPRPRLPPRDPNAMDTSAGKATTEEQKKKHRDEGRCYECSKQGHISRNCPTRKLNARSAEIEEAEEDTNGKGAQPEAPWLMKDMIARAAKFSDEERLAFIQGLQDDKETEDPGFLEA